MFAKFKQQKFGLNPNHIESLKKVWDNVVKGPKIKLPKGREIGALWPQVDFSSANHAELFAPKSFLPYSNFELKEIFKSLKRRVHR